VSGPIIGVVRSPDPVPRELSDSPFHRRDALGATTVGRLRGPAYRRLAHGVYDRADAPLTHERRIRAWREAISPGAVLGGWSAALALGVGWVDTPDDVEVVFDPDRRIPPRPGLRIRGDLLLPGETVMTHHGLATSGPRTAFDLGRRGSLESAVAAVDAVLRASRCVVAELRAVEAMHPGVRGVRMLRQAIDLADPRSESPPESRLRVRLVTSGLPSPTPQWEVHDEHGVFVARLDLAWPTARVAVEYDGDHHRERRHHSRDLLRHNRLRALGWQVLQVDTLDAQPRIIAQLRGLLLR
jgi:hypothetical protein